MVYDDIDDCPYIRGVKCVTNALSAPPADGEEVDQSLALSDLLYGLHAVSTQLSQLQRL